MLQRQEPEEEKTRTTPWWRDATVSETRTPPAEQAIPTTENQTFDDLGEELEDVDPAPESAVHQNDGTTLPTARYC